MYFITAPDERPDGWVHLSDANHWSAWLGRNIPTDLHQQVRSRVASNVKHILVGLVLKKALILPHAQTDQGQSGVLFEPYFQALIFEFCVGAFSVIEVLGATHWLSQNGHDGADRRKIHRNDWRPSLCAAYDPIGEHGLDAAVLRRRTLERSCTRTRSAPARRSTGMPSATSRPLYRRATPLARCYAGRLTLLPSRMSGNSQGRTLASHARTRVRRFLH